MNVFSMSPPLKAARIFAFIFLY